MDGHWGPEEFFVSPLVPGSTFKIVIRVEFSGFHITFDGAHLPEFGHRLPFGQVTHIAFDGDALLNSFTVEGPNDASASSPSVDPGAAYGQPVGNAPYPMGSPGMAPGLSPSLGGASISPQSGPPVGHFPPVNPYIAPRLPPSASIPHPSGGGGSQVNLPSLFWIKVTDVTAVSCGASLECPC